MPARAFAWWGGVASLAIAVGAYGVGWIAPATDVDDSSVLSYLRTQSAAVLASRLLVVSGVLLLVFVWLLLGRQLRIGTAIPTDQLVRTCWWWGTPLVVAPVLFSRDVFSYIAQSRLLPLGIDPYHHGPGVLPSYLGDGADPLWRSVPAPYGPGWFAASSLLFRVTGANPVLALLGFRLLAVVGVALIAVFLPRLATSCGVDPANAVWLCLLNPLLFLHLLSAAHNDALMIGLLVAGVAVAMQGSSSGALVLISVAAAVKAPALIAIPFVGVAWAYRGATTRWTSARRLVLTALIPMAVFALLGLVAGAGLGWMNNIGAPDRVKMWLSPTTAVGMTLSRMLDLLGLGGNAGSDVLMARRIGIGAAVLLVGWLLVTWQRRSVARSVGISLVVVALLAPLMQPWYLLWGLVVLAGAGLRALEQRTAVVVTVVLALYSVANTNATAISHLALRDGPAAAVSVGLGLALVLATRRARML